MTALLILSYLTTFLVWMASTLLIGLCMAMSDPSSDGDAIQKRGRK